MRSGTWGGARTLDNVRVTVAGTVRPVRSVTVTSGMRDGHPLSDTSQWCVVSTIEWVAPPLVFSGAPHPFGVGTEWLPKSGDSVLIETGDGATGQWWPQHVGMIDVTSGSFADGTAQSTTVDRIDELGGPVSMWAALARSAPAIEGQPYRQVGMSSTFLVDRMFRHTHDISGNSSANWTGWYATPPPTWQTVGSAPCMGSLIPDVGYVREADRKSSPGQGPVWWTVPYGVTPSDYTARYDLSSPASTPILSMGILDAGTGQGWIAATDEDGAGLRILYNRDSGNVAVAVLGSTLTQAWSVPLGANRRVAAYLQRTGVNAQTVRLRMEDGTETLLLGTSADLPAGWAATRVVVNTDIPLGWWMVENNKPIEQRWFTIDHVPTARLRIGDHNFMEASRDIYLDDAAEWTQEQVDAECAQAWLDEDGVMQWAGRGILEAQGVAQTVTSGIRDVQWEIRNRRLSRNLSITFDVPQVSMGLQGRASRVLWEGSSSDLAGGETDVTLVNVPADEDWFSVDTAPGHVYEWGKSWEYYAIGSKYGGTQYVAASSDAAVWAPFLNCTMTYLNARAYEVSFGPWASIPSTHRVNSKAPTSTTGDAASGRPMLVMRGRAKATWREVESLTQVNAAGRGTYAHHVGWRVQNQAGAVTALRVWMSNVVGGEPLPIVTLTLAHDPRRQIGDKLRIQDQGITGLDWDQLAQERTIRIDASTFTDTISGRLTLVRTTPAPGTRLTPAGHTALTPASNWNREVAP